MKKYVTKTSNHLIITAAPWNYFVYEIQQQHGSEFYSIFSPSLYISFHNNYFLYERC